jgi:signal transduction histidine kinase/CheY-like chemotaxis protein
MNRPVGSHRHPLHDDFEELRADALRRLAAMVIAVSVGLICLGLVDRRVGVPEIWIVVTTLFASAACCWWVVRRSLIAAAAVLYLGLIGSAIGAAIVYVSPSILFALPLVVTLLPLLIGYKRTGLLAIITSAPVWTAHGLGLFSIAGADVPAIIALTAFSLPLSWIAFRPISTTLDWAWAGYQGEQRKTDEVRLRQAELAQTSKSLAETVERLEQVNLELLEARRAADDARHLKDQFVTTISHELRTPLNLIIGFSEIISSGPSADAAESLLSPALQRDVETIYRNACHLSTLVDDVLDLSRLEAHRLAMRKEWSNLRKVVDEALESVLALYERAGLSVFVKIEANLPDLYVDPTRIRQVLINLLVNAVRYIEDGGVTVSARRDGGDVVVSVKDTGMGIPPDDLSYVFEPFRQTGQLRRRGGFGLGLTVSKQFIEMHGGSMWVESTVNQGTTFQFTLPLTDNVAAVAPGFDVREHFAVNAPGAADRTILLVDRDGESARVFERYLDECRIVMATSVSDVTRLAKKERISAVVVVTGSEPSAGDLIEAAALDLAPVPLVRCTLRTKSSSGRSIGAAGFLSKPVRSDEIYAIVHRLRPQPRRILVIDDDPDMLRLLEATLRRIVPSSLIETASDGEQGLFAAENGFNKQLPDLVFLDLLMPNLDGNGFLRVWREDPRWHGIPVVVVSAASEEGLDVITCDSLEICRDGGLTIGEMIRVIRGGLDGLLAPCSNTIRE